MDEVLDWALAQRYLALWISGAAALLVVISGIVWWRAVYENPYNVYWGMLANSLSTSSVTKRSVEQSSGNDLNQYVTLTFGATNFAHGLTTLKNAASSVTTESIGTMQTDYVRYTNVQTSQKNKQGKTPSFSSVLNKWAKADAANTGSQSASAPFFIQAILGLAGGNIVPMANLPASQRGPLLDSLHKSVVFNVDMNNVQKSTFDGRPAYTYFVAVEPVAYVGFEKSLASDLGIKTLENVDPNSYQGQSAMNVQLVIDVRSHHLVKLVYPGGGHYETYGSYGVPAHITLPKATISDAELQTLLSSAQ